LKLPRVSSAPSHENDIVRKSFVDSEILSARTALQLAIDVVENRLIAEEERAKAEEERIEALVEVEEQRALAAEAAIDLRVDSEIFRATQKEAEIEASVATKIPLAYIGAANGVVPLGADSKIASQYLPKLALSEVFVVETMAQAQALVPADVQEGDVVKVTSEGKTYIYDGATFLEITADSAVDSVNGQTGTVVLDSSMISEAGDYRYYTAAREAELLKRDGSSSITGQLLPDQDLVREFGGSSYRFSTVNAKELRYSLEQALSFQEHQARLLSGNLEVRLDAMDMSYAVQLLSNSDASLKLGNNGIRLTQYGRGLTVDSSLSTVELAYNPLSKLTIDGQSLKMIHGSELNALTISNERTKLENGGSKVDLKQMGDSYIQAGGLQISTGNEGSNSFAPTLVLGGSEGGMSGTKLRNGYGEFSLNGEEAKISFGMMGSASSVKVKQDGEIELYASTGQIKLAANDGVKFEGIESAYLDMDTHAIKNLLDPVDPQDAATKNHVSQAISALFDQNQKLKFEYVPAIAISDIYVVQNIAARDALTVEEGDVAKVIEAVQASDGAWMPRTYIYAVDNASMIGSWVEITSEGDVMSVAGKHGHVTLDTGDVSEKVDGPLYFTDARAKSAAVVDSIMGGEHDQAPSAHAAKAYIDSEVTSAKAYTDSELDKLEVQSMVYESFTLSAQDVANGYVDVSAPIVAVPLVFRQHLKGRHAVDFTYSGSRITFTGEWSSTGASLIATGDLVEVYFLKNVKPYLN